MTSRSNREARPHQIVDGGGKVSSGSRSGSKSVKPKAPEKEPSFGERVIKEIASGRHMKKGSTGKSGGENVKEKSGWSDIGEGGANIVKGYQKRKAAKAEAEKSSSSKSTGGR